MAEDVFSGAVFHARTYSDDVVYDPTGNTVTVQSGGSYYGSGDGSITLNGTAAAAGDAITLSFNSGGPVDIALEAVADFSNGILLTDGAGSYVLVTGSALNAAESYTLAGTLGNFAAFSDPACFAAGTRIATPRGEVAVEALRPGDLVQTALGRGPAQVRWLSHRKVTPAAWADPREAWPIRVAAHAFGPGRPVRDLLLSPHHCVFFEGVLVPVVALVDGRGIVQEACAAITYWHVELDRHDVLLAEGLPAESYFDCGNRAGFAHGTASPPPAATRRCARMVLHGAELARLRGRLGTAPARATATASVFAQSWRGAGPAALMQNVKARPAMALAV